MPANLLAIPSTTRPSTGASRTPLRWERSKDSANGLCMQLVRDRGGESIAVYPDAKNKAIAENLLAENRVSFIEKADYSANSSLDKIVKEIIDKMVKKDLLEQKRNNQTNQLPDDA